MIIRLDKFDDLEEMNESLDAADIAAFDYGYLYVPAFGNKPLTIHSSPIFLDINKDQGLILVLRGPLTSSLDDLKVLSEFNFIDGHSALESAFDFAMNMSKKENEHVLITDSFKLALIAYFNEKNSN